MKKPEKMKPKALRKELVEEFGHDKEFIKRQPIERLVKILTTDRNIREMKAERVVEVARELVDEFGYDPESVGQQTETELRRMRDLERAGRDAGATQPEGAAKPKRKKTKAPEPEPVEEPPFEEDAFDDLAEFDDDEGEFNEPDEKMYLSEPDDEDIEPAPAPKKKKKKKVKAKPVSGAEALADDAALEAEFADVIDKPGSLFLGMPGTFDYRFDGHAGAGPSGAERWIHCTASLQASRRFLETLTPNQQAEFAKANESARQGTTAHAAAEVKAHVILGQATVEEAENLLMELAIEPETASEAYDEEMEEYITEYVDLVAQYAQDRGRHNIMVEARVTAAIPLTGKHADEVHEVPGSADFVALPTKAEPDLVVADLKYGNGVDVSVDENPQVRIYALGVLAELCDEEGRLPDGIESITYHIVQPRLGGIKTWSEPVDDLLDWSEEVLAPALTAALYGASEGATFNPSEVACQWCPARGTCPALAEARTAAAAELFDAQVETEYNEGPGALLDSASLTDERLGTLLAQAIGIAKITEDLKAEAQRRLHRGDQVPGFKLVSYTPVRKWKGDAELELDPANRDEGRLSEEMASALWSRKLVTPTQALKIVGKDNEVLLDDLIEVPDKRPIVAPANDKRKVWSGKLPEDMFNEENA